MAYNLKTTRSSAGAAAIFIALNLLFFTCTIAHNYQYDNVHCPIDTLKLGVCAKILDGLIDVTLGKPPKQPCCNLIDGLVDAEAAVCLCTALKANVLGLKLNVPIDLTLLLNYCGKSMPNGFKCA